MLHHPAESVNVCRPGKLAVRLCTVHEAQQLRAHLEGLEDAQLGHVTHSAGNHVHPYLGVLVAGVPSAQLRHDLCCIQACRHESLRD